MESINAAGIYHFVLKPWDPTELRLLIGARGGAPPSRPRAGAARGGPGRAQPRAGARAGQSARGPGRRRRARRRCAPSCSATSRPGWSTSRSPRARCWPARAMWRAATVLFADIRGFTRLIESTPAPVTIRLLDEYFAAMIDIIFAHQGTVEQLIGDEIVALFGLTESEPDAAARAVLRRPGHDRRRAGAGRPLGRGGPADLRHRRRASARAA